jgi:hypothetical protein
VGLLGIWLVCALCAVLAVPWMFVSILRGSPRTWTLAKGFDRVGNVMTGGVDDEYLSARAQRTQGGAAVGMRAVSTSRQGRPGPLRQITWIVHRWQYIWRRFAWPGW